MLACVLSQSWYSCFCSKKREAVPELAPMLWHSFGTIAALLQEIINIYPAIHPPNLTVSYLNNLRLCSWADVAQLPTGMRFDIFRHISPIVCATHLHYFNVWHPILKHDRHFFKVSCNYFSILILFEFWTFVPLVQRIVLPTQFLF